MKLWAKGYKTEKIIEDFTVGNDYKLDENLAKYDVMASIAHAKMLQKIGILSEVELQSMLTVFDTISMEIESGQFVIEKEFEDVHSKLEFLLTEALGETGKKIHTARSRNDQVLVAMQLYIKDEIKSMVQLIGHLFDTLIFLSKKHQNVIIPGYTHMQIAMPSSLGLWFGAYAESFVDDIYLLQAAYKIANQNPLGSAAGYGTSFPIERSFTTKLLAFEDLKYNVVAAQLSRGKVERSLAFGLAAISSTLSKLSMDICLYTGQNFGFFTFPDHLTTGSSIMPHKKNMDVFELIRGHCNKIQSIPATLTLITNNLISGYHRDFQLLKESLLPAIDDMKSCLHIANYMLKEIIINDGFMEDEKYKYLFSVESVNEKVNEGYSFREAYKTVALEIAQGKYKPIKTIHHTHEGSIGNLCNDEIVRKFKTAVKVFAD